MVVSVRKATTLSEEHDRGETSLRHKDGAQLSYCAFEGNHLLWVGKLRPREGKRLPGATQRGPLISPQAPPFLPHPPSGSVQVPALPQGEGCRSSASGPVSPSLTTGSSNGPYTGSRHCQGSLWSRKATHISEGLTHGQ